MYIPAYLNTTYPVRIMLLVCMFSALKFHQHGCLNKNNTIRHANMKGVLKRLQPYAGNYRQLKNAESERETVIPGEEQMVVYDIFNKKILENYLNDI